jgi:CheY-like chemotaxis protein
LAPVKPSILIVDDEFGLAEMLRDVMRDSGYDVSLAMNGLQALETLDEKRVDLVLTDIMMPVMDGAELVATMRLDDKYRATPVIVMTSLPRITPEVAAMVSAVLRKPFTPDVLLDAIVACLADVSDSGN